jgi:hypothetical protein
MSAHRTPSPARFAAAIAATALVAACASRTPRYAPEKDVETKLFADSTSWLNGARACETTDDAGVPSVSPALRPVDPWVGAVGVKFGVRGEYEYGVGLCVPSSTVGGTGVEPSEIGRTRQTAVGVWLKLDF